MTLSAALCRVRPPPWLAGMAGRPAGRGANRLSCRICAASDDQEIFGNAVRRLNSDLSGFRTLLTRTPQRRPRCRTRDARSIWRAIDPRWGEPRFWAVIKAAMPRYTDRNLLAAVDLKRDAIRRHRRRGSGCLGQPPDHAAHASSSPGWSRHSARRSACPTRSSPHP